MTKESFNRGSRILLAIVWVVTLAWAGITQGAGGFGAMVAYLLAGTLVYMLVCMGIAASLPKRGAKPAAPG